MIKVDTIKNVSHLQILDNCIIIGIDSSFNGESGLVSHGDRIVKYFSGISQYVFYQKYFSFITYGRGILYYENEGAPIFYTDFKETKQITSVNHFFNSLQNRINTNSVLIAESDENFNKSYYIFSINFEKKLLPKFSDLLLNDSFICTTKNTVELFSSDSMNLCWIYQCDEGFQLDRRNKLFADQDLIYIPLKGGALIALDIQNGDEKWRWQGDAEYVAYGEQGHLIYVHAGDKILVVSKVSGQIENVINYSDYEELNSFRANGIIWCFENIILVRNSGSGEVVLFNRETFKLIGRETVDELGIGESRDRIRMLDNYLYILGTSSTVHIYDLNPGTLLREPPHFD